MAEENTQVVVEFLGDISDIEDKLKALKLVYKNLRKSFNQSIQSATNVVSPDAIDSAKTYTQAVKTMSKVTAEADKQMRIMGQYTFKKNAEDAKLALKQEAEAVVNTAKAETLAVQTGAKVKEEEAKRIRTVSTTMAKIEAREYADAMKQKADSAISAEREKTAELQKNAKIQLELDKQQRIIDNTERARISAEEHNKNANRRKEEIADQREITAELRHQVKLKEEIARQDDVIANAEKKKRHKERVKQAEELTPKQQAKQYVLSDEEKSFLKVVTNLTKYSQMFLDMDAGLKSLALDMGNIMSIFQGMDVEPVVAKFRSLYDEAIIVSQAVGFMGDASRHLEGLIDKLALMKEYGVNLVHVYTTLTNLFGTMAGTGEKLTVPTFNQEMGRPKQNGIRFDPNAVDTVQVFTSSIQQSDDAVSKLEANLAGVYKAMARMQWNNGTSLQNEFSSYAEDVRALRDSVGEVTDRIEAFKATGKTNKNFDKLLSTYTGLDAVIGKELRDAQQLVEENNRLINDKQNLGRQYQREYDALKKNVTAQREIYENAKQSGDVLKMEGARKALEQYNTEAIALRKRFEDIRGDKNYIAIDNRQVQIAQQYRNIIDDISKKSRKMVNYGSVLENALDNNGGNIDDKTFEKVDRTPLDKFLIKIHEIKGGISEIGKLSGISLSKFSGGISTLAGAIGKVHPALIIIATILRLIKFLLGQVVQGFTRIVRVAKAVANAFVNAVKPAVTIAVKAVKSLVKSIVSFGTNTVKKTLSAPFKLIEKGIKSVSSLLSMLRTRIKRRVVAEMFEDLTGTLASMSEQRDQFNESMSSMVMALRMFGSQIIAIAQPILEILAPAVEFVSNLLTGVADKLSQFTARLNGQDTYFKASEGVYDFASAMKEASGETESATESAKAYENTVMGFDQLNKLNGTKDNSSGSSSKKKNTASPVNMKKALTEANALNQLADKIRKAFKNKDFKNAGKYVAEAVNDAFSWLDNVAGWEKNADKIKGFTKGVIDFINGFSEGIDPKVIGHAIGDVLNSGIEFVKMMTDPNEGVDFKLIGRNIGETLQNAILTIKWEDLGKAFVQTIQSFVRTAVGFLTTPGLFTDIAIALRDALTGAVDAFSPDDWSDLFAGILNGIGDFMSVTFDDSNTSFSKAGEKLAEMLNKTFDKVDLEKLSSGFAGFIRSLGSFLFSTLTNTNWGDMLGGFVVMLAETLVKIFEDPTGEKDLYTSAEEKGKAFGSSLADGLNKFVETIKDRKDTIVDGIVASIKAVMSAVGTFLTESDWGTLFATLINGFFEAMGKLFSSPEKARKFGEDLSAKVRDMFEQLDTETISSGIQNFFDSFGEFMGGLLDDDTVNKIREVIGDILDDVNIPKVLDDCLKWSNFGIISETVKGIGKDIGGWIIDGLGEGLASLPDKLWDGISGAWNWCVDQWNNGDQWYISFPWEEGGFGIKKLPNSKGRANGGTVGDGELFIANEHGAEAIVRGDGGRTIVTNNQQMIMAITNGVRSAMSDAMRVMSGNNNNGNGGDIVLYVDSEELARASLRGQRSLDKRLNPVIQFA